MTTRELEGAAVVDVGGGIMKVFLSDPLHPFAGGRRPAHVEARSFLEAIREGCQGLSRDWQDARVVSVTVTVRS